jgi:tetrahydromethanopterin S-methyltransferase subunit H
LLNFEAEQKTFEFGKTRIGGMPGLRPVVLVGTIFYHKHNILTDERKGEFDQAKAELLINVQDEWAEKTGNPCMIDVVASTKESMIKYLSFVSEKTEAPILLDGILPEVRIASLDYVKEVGLTDRVIYDSITPNHKQAEFDKIRMVGIKSSILLAYSMKDFTTDGRINCIKDLVAKAKSIGIDKPIIDTCVFDLPSFGPALASMHELKKSLGYPVGCGAHNAIALWKGLKRKLGKQASKPCTAATMSACVVAGADYILYGPLEDAEYAFPATAMMDVAYSQLHIEKRIKPAEDHPRYKVG